jgi:hypothetical protein
MLIMLLIFHIFSSMKRDTAEWDFCPLLGALRSQEPNVFWLSLGMRSECAGL